MMSTHKILIGGAVLLACTFGCKKPNKETATFDKKAMLKNVSTNIISPEFNEFQTELASLKSAFQTFEGDKTNTNLSAVKDAWKTAYLSWQTVKIFDFGPMRTLGFKGSAGIFPIDTTKITNNVASGSANLATAANADAVGFSAIEYMLYQNDALNKFNDANYSTYTSTLINKIHDDFNSVLNDWNGGYKATFETSDGTATTSAFSQMVNEFSRDYELMKNAKVGIPIGKKSLGVALPAYIETKYAKFSFELITESATALKRVFNGGTGQGFDDYLNTLEKSSLTNSINSKFDNIITQSNAFSTTFADQLSTNPVPLDNLYNTIASGVVFIKTDMTSAFGVLITYQDNDGD